MNFDLTAPCGNCPFRTDKPEQQGWLGGERAEEIIESITNYQQSFPCHKTTDATLGNKACSSKEQHCAGALIMLEKMNQPNQMMRISERLGFYDRHKLKIDSPVFDDPEDFIEWHEGA